MADKTACNFTHVPKPRPGIALLITLVILALLAVFMTEFAFETNLETRGIRNFQASFKARNAVKSLFKAVKEGLVTQDETDFFRLYLRGLVEIATPAGSLPSFLNPPGPAPLPAGILADFPEVTFFTPSIRPIDHLFNLNRIDPGKFPESDPDRKVRNEFLNLFKQIRIEFQPSAGTPEIQNTMLEDEVRTLYASIYDWNDDNSEDNYPQSFIEGHVDSDTGWSVKDKRFDRLGEILLIQSKLLEEGLISSWIPLSSDSRQKDSWNRHFTVFAVGKENSPRINVNLASATEIENFISRFQSTSSIENNKEKYSVYAELIGEALQPSGFGMEPKTYKNIDEIKKTLENEPSTAGLWNVEKDFFLVYSNWYEIHLKAEIENVRAELKAVMEVKREDNGKVKTDGNGEPLLTIHDFILR